MTLEQLRIFLAVAQHLHFTRAATALYISQPAVSAAIQKLEDLYGLRLFHRIGRRIELTEAGLLLQKEARKVLDQVGLIERGLRELNNLQSGQLNLGSSLTIGNYWLPHLISRFKVAYPGVQVSCSLGNNDAIVDGILAGQHDLALVEGVIQPDALQQLEQKPFASDRLQIVVGIPHPWYDKAVVGVEELLDTAWVMREEGSGTRQRFEQALRRWGIDPTQLQVALVLNSGEMVKMAVENGLGATALSELMVAKELRLGSLRPVKVLPSQSLASTDPPATSLTPLSRPFLLLKHRERFQSRLSQTFEQMLWDSTQTSGSLLQLNP
jgi:DNA-binding transcriptional LysR family regulator